MGPGFVTGASDDDPSGIGTYAQAGAQFGTGLLWTMLFTYPLMVAIQEISARLGRVTGRGLALNLRHICPRWLLYVLLALLAITNTVNIGADVSAMAAASQLLFGGPALAYAIGFAAISIVLEIFVPYHRYAKILMVLTGSLAAYVATAAVVEIPWADALRRSFVPELRSDASYFMMIVAVFGTTISPYLFFWQASEEVEEERNDAAAKPLLRAPWQGPTQLRRIRTDTLIGMGASNLIAWFIMLTTSATLHRSGTRDIESAAQAAAALEPIAGKFAAWLFAAGIVGTGLLALPVLAGSVAYALGEAMHFRIGLELKPKAAPRFYAAITLAMVLGAAMNALPLSPMKALVYTAVLNGVVAVPIMIMVMRLAMDHEVMGRFVTPPVLAVLGWAATAVMLVATIVMFATLGRS